MIGKGERRLTLCWEAPCGGSRVKARANLIQHSLRVRLLGAQSVHENRLAVVLVNVAAQVDGLQLLGALPSN